MEAIARSLAHGPFGLKIGGRAPTIAPMDSFAQKVAEIHSRDQQARARGDLWLAHHWPEEYRRCVLIGRHHVCRRCLVLYPLTFAVALAALGGLLLWPRDYDPALIWLLSIPGTVEYVAEQLGFISYRSRRQALATALVAIPLGRGLSYELDDRWHWYFWGPLLVFGTIWFVSTAIGRQVRRREASASVCTNEP